MKRTLVILSAVVSAIYILNPTAGFIELIPDNMPVIGNLDEGAAAYVLFSAISYLMGKDIGLFATKEDDEGGDDGWQETLDHQ